MSEEFIRRRNLSLHAIDEAKVVCSVEYPVLGSCDFGVKIDVHPDLVG